MKYSAECSPASKRSLRPPRRAVARNMRIRVDAAVELLRADYAAVRGRPFRNFYCPILFRDEAVSLCMGHVINEAFGDSDRHTTVQRTGHRRQISSALSSRAGLCIAHSEGQTAQCSRRACGSKTIQKVQAPSSHQRTTGRTLPSRRADSFDAFRAVDRTARRAASANRDQGRGR